MRANKTITKGFRQLRRDLAIIPWLLAEQEDVVLAPKPRKEFHEYLSRLPGLVGNLPNFCETSPARKFQGVRPYGIPGPHLGRSNIVQYREDVRVCRTISDVREAVASCGPKVAIKTEFSSSGMGQRIYDQSRSSELDADGSSIVKWACKCLRLDGVLTVEPWLDILAEFSGEWLNGNWNGVSQCLVQNGRWHGQWLGDPGARSPPLSEQILDFVFKQRSAKRFSHLAGSFGAPIVSVSLPRCLISSECSQSC
eukprot:SAG31_NODE_60_length_29419_cov_39.876398_7_plen_253_part_00